MLEAIGNGAADVHTVGEMARACVESRKATDGVRSIASLGASGRHPQNEERDLHRWLANVFGDAFQTEELILKLY